MYAMYVCIHVFARARVCGACLFVVALFFSFTYFVSLLILDIIFRHNCLTLESQTCAF